MAMFFENISINNTRLMGMWHSDATMLYLHGQARPIVGRLAEVMYNNGDYSIIDSYDD
jgi:hypothetical protein